MPNSASVPNSATVPNLDDARGHKAITESEKPLQPEFNQSKAKTNDNCSKLSASDPHETKRGEKYEIQKPSTCGAT